MTIVTGVTIRAVVLLRVSPNIAVSVRSLSPLLRFLHFFLPLLKRNALPLRFWYEFGLRGSRFFIALGL